MKSINLKNNATNTKLEVRVLNGGVSFFILPRKHSKYWIPITTTKKEANEIRDAFLDWSE